MTERGQITWRWIWCWLGVLVAGCSRGGTPTVTALPLATFPGYTHIPPTLTPILRVLRTPPGTLSLTAIRSTAASVTPSPLTLDPPDCYETPVGSLWCLGLVRNSLPIILEGVTIRVYLVSRDGTALAQRETLVARRIVRPGEESPYGALFDSVPTGYAGPVPELVTASKASPTEAAAVSLTVRGTQAEVRDSGFRVSGEPLNPATTPLQAESSVVTLFDAEDRVIGFRQIEDTEPIGVGAALSFTVDVIPQIGDARLTARYEIAADGR